MKEDKHAKNPGQEAGLCDISYARFGNGDDMLVSLCGAQIWPPETNKNISFRAFLLMLAFIA